MSSRISSVVTTALSRFCKNLAYWLKAVWILLGSTIHQLSAIAVWWLRQRKVLMKSVLRACRVPLFKIHKFTVLAEILKSTSLNRINRWDGSKPHGIGIRIPWLRVLFFPWYYIPNNHWKKWRFGEANKAKYFWWHRVSKYLVLIAKKIL